MDHVAIIKSNIGRSGRVKTIFNSEWRFFKGDAAGAQLNDFDDSGWQTINLPHDWSIEGPFTKENASGPRGGYAPTGIGWYKKTFLLSEECKDKKVFIEFDGIYMNSDIWLNGYYLGHYPYGYTSICYDLSKYLNFGEKSNTLSVRVDTSIQPGSRWYSGSGIYRHVWLTIVDPLHVAYCGTYITTPVISEEEAEIHIKTHIQNEHSEDKTCTLISRLIDKDCKVIGQVETVRQIQGGSDYEFEQDIAVKHPQLWSIDTPYLYKIHTQVKCDDVIVDEYETPIGIREIIFDPDKGFLLNGKSVKIKGVCLHHDGGCLGAACPDRAVERQIEILKKMGCNAIRASHNPPSPVLLDCCDKMGILVMDEAFDEWTEGKWPRVFVDRELAGHVPISGYHLYYKDWAIKDLTSMIRRDRNHPSIIMWSVGNEIPECAKPEGVELTKQLIEVVHKEDPSRPATTAICNIPGANKVGVANLPDVVGYNYKEKLYLEDHAKYPKRCIVGSETRSAATFEARGCYDLFIEGAKVLGKQRDVGLNKELLGADLASTDSVQRILTAEDSWRVTRDNNFVEGLFIWTGFDYIGEPTPFSWPSKSSYFGVIDLCGFPKDAYYFYQSQWTEEPMIHIFPHWNWSGKEGCIIPVWCYTNCDSVELFINEKSVGVEDFKDNPYLHLSWNVAYEPGILKAVGKKGGKIVCLKELKTAGVPAKVVLSADRTVIQADGKELSYITVSIHDEDGNIVPDANNMITFDIEGEARIIGVDNGNPCSHESYKVNYRKAFNGLCLAVLQTTTEPGGIYISASSPGLAAGTIMLRSVI